MAPCCLASSLAGLIAFNLPGIHGDVGSHLRTLWIVILMVPISEGFDGGVAGGLRPMGGLRICVCEGTSITTKASSTHPRTALGSINLKILTAVSLMAAPLNVVTRSRACAPITCVAIHLPSMANRISRSSNVEVSSGGLGGFDVARCRARISS